MTSNACRVPSGLAHVAPGPRRLVKARDQRRRSETAGIVIVGARRAFAVYLSCLFPKPRWTIAHFRTWNDGQRFVAGDAVDVIICESVLRDGSWRDAATALPSFPDPPALIVLGDDPSIAPEVEALGGFDTLIRPLREDDLVWTVASAWNARTA